MRFTVALGPVISPYVSKTTMLKFTIKAVHDSLGVISTIQGCRTQVAPWPLKMSLISGLRKITHMNHPSKGYGQYLRTNVNQGVISNICFSLTKRMGKFFVIPDAASADISQKIAQSQWEAKKTMEENFDTVCTALTQIFKRIIDDSYHTGFIKVDQINQTMS